VIRQIIAGQFVQRYGTSAPDLRAKTVAVEHLKTSRFPPPPFPRVAQVANWNASCAKVKVDQIGSTLAVNIATFDHDPLAGRAFSVIELILSDSTNEVAACDRPSGMRRSFSGFPFLESNMALASP